MVCADANLPGAAICRAMERRASHYIRGRIVEPASREGRIVHLGYSAGGPRHVTGLPAAALLVRLRAGFVMDFGAAG
jgi:hypothetical protein